MDRVDSPERLRQPNASVQRLVSSGEPTDTAPRTLIVSDVRLFRDGLALALGSRTDIELIGAEGSLNAAVERLAGTPPAVVLLDSGMPHTLEMARAIMRLQPTTKIIAIAVSDESADVIACAEAGMAGYVSRDGSIEEVAETIHAVVRGELHCAPHVVATLFRRLAALSPEPSTPQDDQRLTPRELEIVALIDEGLSNKTIGGRLRIGTPTVKNHVHHILEKLKVRRRGEAAALIRTGHTRASRAMRSRQRSSEDSAR
jgi:two-component system nitrate/nitrite response regulator NarL